MSLGTRDASERAGVRPVRRPSRMADVPTGYGQAREPADLTPPCQRCRYPLVRGRIPDRNCPRCAAPVPWNE